LGDEVDLTQNRKHVLDDIQPYVCTYSDCDLPEDHFFTNKEEWYRHETQRHRVKWHCTYEKHPEYEKLPDFLLHMRYNHHRTIDLSQSSQQIDVFRRALREPAGACNLCQRQSTNLRSHVSRHLQQMALFALPRHNKFDSSVRADDDIVLSERNKESNDSQDSESQTSDKQPSEIQNREPSSEKTPIELEKERWLLLKELTGASIENLGISDSTSMQTPLISPKIKETSVSKDGSVPLS